MVHKLNSNRKHSFNSILKKLVNTPKNCFKTPGGQACVSQKTRKLYEPEKPFVKLLPAYSVKLVFSHVVKEIKMKITAKFRDTKHLRFEHTKRIMSPEKFRDFRETGPRAELCTGSLGTTLGKFQYGRRRRWRRRFWWYLPTCLVLVLDSTEAIFEGTFKQEVAETHAEVIGQRIRLSWSIIDCYDMTRQ